MIWFPYECGSGSGFVYLVNNEKLRTYFPSFLRRQESRPFKLYFYDTQNSDFSLTIPALSYRTLFHRGENPHGIRTTHSRHRFSREIMNRGESMDPPGTRRDHPCEHPSRPPRADGHRWTRWYRGWWYLVWESDKNIPSLKIEDWRLHIDYWQWMGERHLRETRNPDRLDWFLWDRYLRDKNSGDDTKWRGCKSLCAL